MDPGEDRTGGGRSRGLRGLRVLAAAALRGVVAAAFGLGLAELVAGLVGAGSSPVVAVGEAVINLVPGSVKDFAIEQFGSNDKLVLVVTVLVLLVVLAAVAGLLALRNLAAGISLVVLLGAVGVAAAVSGSLIVAAIPSVVAAVAGGMALWLLVHLSRRAATPEGEAATESSVTPVHSRRVVLSTGAGMVVVAGAAAAGGRGLQGRRFDVADSRGRVRLPAPADPAEPLPPGHAFDVPGQSPFVTSNANFYRVDYDLTVPKVPTTSWSLKVHGNVARPVELSFDDLLRHPLVERDMTLCCVSNEVGGPYVSTTRWLGVSLADVLAEAGVRSGADQLLSASADGMTIGTPTELVTDGRDAMIAIAMNGKPLPAKHGFPARLVVPGLYGYASATKWVTDLKLTSFAAESAYWVRRGYVPVGTARTASRIDVPKSFAEVASGGVTVAGVAWALHRGISTVQVRVDGGPWQQAELATSAGPELWRQWRWTWQATPGTHKIEVRAADGAGHMQPGHRMGVFPSGATGWHSVSVTVTG